MTSEEICEALVRHVETSGAELFEKNFIQDGKITCTVWCVIGPNAHEFHGEVRNLALELGFKEDRKVHILFKAPEDTAKIIRQADVLDRACTIELRDLTGRVNMLPSKGAPVVCVQRSAAGYWELHCNDPELPESTLHAIAGRLRKWEGARAMQ